MLTRRETVAEWVSTQLSAIPGQTEEREGNRPRSSVLRGEVGRDEPGKEKKEKGEGELSPSCGILGKVPEGGDVPDGSRKMGEPSTGEDEDRKEGSQVDETG